MIWVLISAISHSVIDQGWKVERKIVIVLVGSAVKNMVTNKKPSSFSYRKRMI